MNGLSTDSLINHLRIRADEHPDALYSRYLFADRNPVETTFGQTESRTRQFADLYAREGVAKGDVVLVILPHHEDLIPAFLGATWLGAIPAFLPSLTAKLDPDRYYETLRSLMQTSKPRTILTYPELRDALERSMSGNDAHPALLLAKQAVPDYVHDNPAPHVRRLTLNRPDKRNALNHEMRGRILEALEDGDRDRDVRVMIVRGAGKCFSSGYDLGGGNEGQDFPWYTPGGDGHWPRHVTQGWMRIWEFGKPVIAQVQDQLEAGHGVLVLWPWPTGSVRGACDGATDCGGTDAAQEGQIKPPPLPVLQRVLAGFHEAREVNRTLRQLAEPPGHPESGGRLDLGVALGQLASRVLG